MADDRAFNQGVNDSLKGTGNDLKGKLEDAAGGLTGDKKLQGEGKLDQMKGKVQDAIGDAERKISK